jgi:hypothetical protein
MARMNWDRVRGENALARTWDYSARLDDEEGRLHGHPDAANGGSVQARPARGRSKPKRAAGKAPIVPRSLQPKAATRAERHRRDAEQAGISVEELKERRRRAALESAAMGAEARRRGITTKQLRRMIERGDAEPPDRQQAPRSGTVVSSTGRTRRAQRKAGRAVR